jgi:hypothetical protein
MPSYVYNVVYRRGPERPVESYLDEPRSFPGSAADFAKVALIAWLERNPHQADEIAIVNVWDADRDGRGVPANIIAQVTNWDLDDGPFATNQIHVGFGWYYVLSPGYEGACGVSGTDTPHA